MANPQIPYFMKPTYKSATYQEISSDYIYIELDCNVREDCREKNATKIYYCFHDKIVRWWRPNGSLRRGRAEEVCRAFDKCETRPHSERFCDIALTEHPENVCTWLREISSCSCLTVLPGPAWVLLSKKYILFPGALYTVYLQLS